MRKEINNIEENFDQIIKMLDELQDKYEEELSGDEEEFEPKCCDRYWVVGANGKATDFILTGDSFDVTGMENKAFFRTEEEAQFEAERIKVLRELERLGSPFDYKSSNWFIYLDFDSDIDCFSRSGFRCAYGDYYFRSYDEAKEAIKTIGEARIKKYLFRVED